MAKQSMINLLRGIYKDIDTGKTANYGSNFVDDLKRVRNEINNQFRLLKAANVAYDDKLVYLVLENVGVAKYF